MAAKGKTNPRPAAKPAAQAPNPARKTEARTKPETQFFQPGFWGQNWMPVLALMGLSFLLYHASVAFGYVLDDQMVIWENAYVQKGFGGLREIFAYDSFMGYFREQKFLLEGGRYRPLSLATFAMEVGFFGKDHPGMSHFINIVCYGLTGIVLYRVLQGLFPPKEGSRWFFSLAFLGAAIFLLHPLHVEVVANIKGRDEILALLGSLGSVYATLKYFDTERKIWLWASGLLLFLGLMAKENALTFLAVVPVTLWIFTKVSPGRILSASVPLVVASVLFFIIRYRAMGYVLNHGQSVDDLMNNPFLGMTGGERLATIFLTLGWYIKLLFAPHPLTHDYYPYHVPKVDWADWKAIGSLALYLALGVYAVWQMARARRNSGEASDSGHKVAAWSILFFLLTLSIVSNLFVGVGTFMNERFVFMPSVAFCVLVAWFLARKLPAWLNEPSEKPYILGIGLAALMFGLSVWKVWTRVPDWENAKTLNTSAVRISYNSCRSHCFYATALYQSDYVKMAKDDPNRAAIVDSMSRHIDIALQINPKYTAALSMKAAIAAAVFDQDHQLDKLFHAWDIVLEKIPNHTNTRKFVGDYLKYLQGRASPQKFAAFCYRTGYEFYYKQRKDINSALEFLNLGLGNQTEDTRVLEALAELYQVKGDAQKAAEFRARANASR